MIKKNPLVSVAIITYNQKEFLRECIESVLSQDYENIEIVVADDGSTDGTKDMLFEYDKKHPNKFVLRISEKNQGITKNCNLAHFACSGKYVAWIGGDDLMLPTKIRKQVEYLENNPNCSVVYHQTERFQSETDAVIGLTWKEKDKKEGDVFDFIKYDIVNNSSMFRRSKVPKKGYNESIIISSDVFYFIETLHNGGTINYIDEVLGRHRRHNNNITNRKEINALHQMDIDYLNTYNYTLFLDKKYFSVVSYRYSRKLLGLRKCGLGYAKICFISFCIFPNIKAIVGLSMCLITFGMLKL